VIDLEQGKQDVVDLLFRKGPKGRLLAGQLDRYIQQNHNERNDKLRFRAWVFVVRAIQILKSGVKTTARAFVIRVIQSFNGKGATVAVAYVGQEPGERNEKQDFGVVRDYLAAAKKRKNYSVVVVVESDVAKELYVEITDLTRAAGVKAEIIYETEMQGDPEDIRQLFGYLINTRRASTAVTKIDNSGYTSGAIAAYTRKPASFATKNEQIILNQILNILADIGAGLMGFGPGALRIMFKAASRAHTNA